MISAQSKFQRAVSLASLFSLTLTISTGCEPQTAYRSLSSDPNMAIEAASLPHSTEIPMGYDDETPVDPESSPVIHPTPNLPSPNHPAPDHSPQTTGFPLESSPTESVVNTVPNTPPNTPSTPPSGLPENGGATCLTNGAALIALGNGSLPKNPIALSGNADILGDAVIAGSGKLSISHSVKFSGKVMAEHADAVDQGNKRKLPVIVQNLQSMKSALLHLNQHLSSLQPTQNGLQSYAGKDAPTFIGNGGINIITLNNLSVSGQSALTIKGSASDLFIFNIKGRAHFSGSAVMKLEGGVRSKNIVFNMIEDGKNAEPRMNITGNAVVHGNILAVGAAVHMSGGSILTGSLISGEKVQVSGGARITAAGGDLCTHPALQLASEK